MIVKATKDCFVDSTYRRDGEEFDYKGPKNTNLEPVKSQRSDPAPDKPGADKE